MRSPLIEKEEVKKRYSEKREFNERAKEMTGKKGGREKERERE